MRMKRRLVIPLILVVLALAIGLVSFSSSTKEEIPYAEFKTLVEEGKVAEAVFTVAASATRSRESKNVF